MNRIDRLLGIITTLQSKKYVAAEKIADKYNISLRTVYRDIKAIGEQGIPVSFEAGRGYFLVQGYFLPPVSFSTDEANALLLMEAVVQRFADKSILKNYSHALDKVKSVMRQPQLESMERLQNSTKFQSCHSLGNDFEYLSALQNAISQKTVIEMDYTNMNGESSCRRAEPIGLIFYAYNWHLVAWCHLRTEYRDFRVSRIVKLKDTGTAFTKTNHIELNEYLVSLPVDY
jgi:predicted DNA-binding transcriptional regulator YafY